MNIYEINRGLWDLVCMGHNDRRDACDTRVGTRFIPGTLPGTGHISGLLGAALFGRCGSN